jgi:uncharacterized protein
MIESTFVLLKGIGEWTEQRLWKHGTITWRDFLTTPVLPGIGQERKKGYDDDLAQAVHHLQAGRSRFFGSCLKPRDHWRLFEQYHPRAVYLDIETTGGPASHGDVTVVGLYADGHMTSLIKGHTLTQDRLNQELAQHDLLVTFCGSLFDLPYLRAKFPGLLLDHPHMDLCYAAKRLSMTGGLKQIERQVGIERPGHLHGLDGWDAVRLWNAWRRGRTAALDLLLQYNEADARNLQPLAEWIYCRLAQRYRPQFFHS